MSAYAESEVQGGRYLGLLEVMSLEVPVKSVGTVARVQSWRQKIPDFRRCDRVASDSCLMLDYVRVINVRIIIINDVHANGR